MLTNMYNFLGAYLKSNKIDTTIQVLSTTDYKGYLDYDFIGFVDNKNSKYNKAFLFKNANLEQYEEIKASIKKDFTIITYNSFTEELVLEVVNKNWLKNITIKMRKE